VVCAGRASVLCAGSRAVAGLRRALRLYLEHLIIGHLLPEDNFAIAASRAHRRAERGCFEGSMREDADRKQTV
jgi:hypothetical protein